MTKEQMTEMRTIQSSVKHRSKTIPADAVPFVLFFLASEAGNTSRVLFQSEKIKLLNLGSG